MAYLIDQATIPEGMTIENVVDLIKSGYAHEVGIKYQHLSVPATEDDAIRCGCRNMDIEDCHC